MAASTGSSSTTDRDKVILFVREKEPEELHIVKNEIRKEILEMLLETTIDELLYEYEKEQKEAERKKKGEAFAVFQFNFFQKVGQISKGQRVTHGSSADVTSVIFFIARCVMKVKLADHKTVEADSPPDSTPYTTSNEFCATDEDNNTKRAALTFGGGCLGEMWKKHKRRRQEDALKICK